MSPKQSNSRGWSSTHWWLNNAMQRRIINHDNQSIHTIIYNNHHGGGHTIKPDDTQLVDSDQLHQYQPKPHTIIESIPVYAKLNTKSIQLLQSDQQLSQQNVMRNDNSTWKYGRYYNTAGTQRSYNNNHQTPSQPLQSSTDNDGGRSAAVLATAAGVVDRITGFNDHNNNNGTEESAQSIQPDAQVGNSPAADNLSVFHQSMVPLDKYYQQEKPLNNIPFDTTNINNNNNNNNINTNRDHNEIISHQPKMVPLDQYYSQEPTPRSIHPSNKSYNQPNNNINDYQGDPRHRAADTHASYATISPNDSDIDSTRVEAPRSSNNQSIPSSYNTDDTAATHTSSSDIQAVPDNNNTPKIVDLSSYYRAEQNDDVIRLRKQIEQQVPDLDKKSTTLYNNIDKKSSSGLFSRIRQSINNKTKSTTSKPSIQRQRSAESEQWLKERKYTYHKQPDWYDSPHTKSHVSTGNDTQPSGQTDQPNNNNNTVQKQEQSPSVQSYPSRTYYDASSTPVPEIVPVQRQPDIPVFDKVLNAYSGTMTTSNNYRNPGKLEPPASIYHTQQKPVQQYTNTYEYEDEKTPVGNAASSIGMNSNTHTNNNNSNTAGNINDVDSNDNDSKSLLDNTDSSTVDNSTSTPSNTTTPTRHGATINNKMAAYAALIREQYLNNNSNPTKQ